MILTSGILFVHRSTREPRDLTVCEFLLLYSGNALLFLHTPALPSLISVVVCRVCSYVGLVCSDIQSCFLVHILIFIQVDSFDTVICHAASITTRRTNVENSVTRSTNQREIYEGRNNQILKFSVRADVFLCLSC